jgi:hypothetical protein
MIVARIREAMSPTLGKSQGQSNMTIQDILKASDPQRSSTSISRHYRDNIVAIHNAKAANFSSLL